MDNNNEIEWKYIDGTHGYYASRCGNIKSHKGRILKPQIHKLGYRIVAVKFTDGTYKSVTVHSMVARAWHGERPEGMDVAHLDHDKTNNSADNLEYQTRQTNILASVELAVKAGRTVGWSVMKVGETVKIPVGQSVRRVAFNAKYLSRAMGCLFVVCAVTETVTRVM